MVKFYSNIGGQVGQAVASTPVSITTAALADGTHQFTATATDLAGNTSVVSAALAVQIETVAPVAPTLDLAAASDTGTIGDQRTAATSVTLEGITEAGARVTLTNPATTVAADAATGAFSLGGIPLVFGANEFIVTAMDLAGNTSSFTRTIRQNNAPTANASGPIAVNEDPGAVTRDLVGLFSDLNLAAGDKLTLSIVANTNSSLVTPSLTGTSGQVVNNSLQLTFGANQNGTATITIRATDLAGEYTDTNIVVNVAPVNDKPVAGSTFLTAEEGTPVTIDLRTLVSDVETVDKNNLSFTVPTATNGTVELLADGHTAQFTPTGNFNGSATFKYTVSDDGAGGTGVQTAETMVFVTVTPFNDPPVANTTSLITVEDTAVEIDLRTLASDTETAKDALIFSVAGATSGAVTLIDGHTARFTPAANYNGPASFTYTVKDTGDGTAAAKTVGPVTISVSITPINDTPTANATTLTTNEDIVVTIDLRTLAEDVETTDDALVFSVEGAQHGTVALIDGHTAQFTPDANYNGPASFTYHVTDTGDGTDVAKTVGPATINVTVNPVNDTPTANTTTLTTNEDTPVDVDLRTLVEDVETVDEALLSFQVGGATKGTVTLVDGHIARFTPSANLNGAASFTYTVTDTADGTAAAKTVGPVTISVTITPINDTPTANATTLTTNEDTVVTIDLRTLAEDVETTDTALVFSVEGAQHGTVALIDGHTAQFTPDANYNGPASFTYHVTDTGDGTDVAKTVGPATINVTVNPVNDTPTANTTTLTTNEDTPVDVDLRTLVEDVETVDEALLSFQVGGATKGTVTLVDGHIARFTPSANLNGAASFTYTVTDTADGTAAAKTVGPVTISVTITPINDTPTANATTLTTNEDTVVTIDLRTLAEDVETTDTALVFSVEGAQHGTVALIDGHTAQFTPDANYNGPASFTYHVTDTGDGTDVAKTVGPATINVTVNPVNDTPTANTTTLTTNEDTPVDVDLRTLVEDVETVDEALLSFQVGGATKGTVTLVDGHIARFTPSANLNGAASFTYTVTDTADGTAAAKTVGPVTISVTITPINDAPTAVDDSRAVANNKATTIDVLANDTDPDVVEGDTLSIASVTQGSHNGTVAIVGGKVVYTPVDLLGLEGTETFSYTVRDAAGETSTIVVTLAVMPNVPPTAVNDTAATTEDATVGGNVLTNDSDSDGGTLSVSHFDALSAHGAVVTVNANGTFTYDPRAAATLQALAAGVTLADTFTYTVSDGQGGETVGTVTVTVTGVNDAPSAVNDAYTLDEDATLAADASRNLLSNDTDIDATDTLSVTGATATSAKGVVVSLNANGTFSYNPGTKFNYLVAGQTATDTFAYTISDGHGGTKTATVTLTINGANDAPNAVNDAYSLGEDSSLPVDASRNLLSNDTDPDTGDTLSVTSLNVTSAQGVAVTINADGTFSYNPGTKFNYLAMTQAAQDSFDYTISDGHGGTKTATVTLGITGANDVPNAVNDAYSVGEDASLPVDASRSLLSNDSDPDTSDTITVTGATTTSVQGVVVSLNANGTFSYNPGTQFNHLAVGQTAQDVFTYTISDGRGGTKTATVTITINGVNDAPNAVNDAYSLGEDASLAVDASRNLLSNDTDPDTGDTLSVTSLSVMSGQGVAVTLNADGTFSYNPGTKFNYLAVGQTAQDSFDYTISDGHGGTKTATVTITINGVNDSPTAVADSAATGENTTVDINVRTNDTDPDSGDTLAVGTFSATSTRGATITLNGDGTLKYDPRRSQTLQALATGAQLVDTFTYTISDGHGGTSTATVSVTVAGSTDAFALGAPIADLTLNDSSSPNSTLVDLLPAFSGDSLTYTATSSNTGLVQVSIVDGMRLQVTYVDYTTAQNRTPAVITVTATDPLSNHLSDQFVVTVTPENTVNVHLVVRDTATAQDNVATLPTSISQVGVGDTYVVEVWMQDTYNSAVTNGPSEGLVAGQFDIAFADALADATALHYNADFTAFVDGTIGAAKVDNFGGFANVITPPTGLGVSPGYTRLGYITFTAAAAGTETFTLSDPMVSRLHLATVDDSQIVLNGASVTQVSEMQSLTFDVTSDTKMQITGTVLGTTLTEASGSSDWAAGITGSLNVMLDNVANPTQMEIASGSLDITPNIPDGPFHPGNNGVDGTADADFAYLTTVPPSDIVQMAIRDLLLGLSTDAALALSGDPSAATFRADLIDMAATGGATDVRSASLNGMRINLTGMTATPTGEETGILNATGTTYSLTFVYSRTIDLSSKIPNTVLTLSGTLVTECTVPTPLMGTVVAPAATDADAAVHMTLSQAPTAVDANGQISALPESETWVDEWDSYYVELWVKASEATGVTAAAADLAYNGAYFTATEIDHGPAFVQNLSGDISQDGLVTNLGGSTLLPNVGADGYVLLGRVKFESLAGDQVALDAENQILEAHDLGLELSNLRVEVDGVAVEAAVGETPVTGVFAIPYDVDDSGRIDLGDLSYFAASYRNDVLTSDSPFVWALDFDHSGSIDLADLSFLASNYGKTQGSDVVFPEGFLQDWIGAGLDVDGETSVGELLDAAVAAWQEKLGLEQPIDIQLVVEDFGTSQLGQGQILEVDENGVPTLGRITIDDDANGLGWYSQLDSTPGQSQYDLYTVLLHEVGHTLGFMTSYDGFAAQVETTGDGKVFVGSDFTAQLDAAGQHLAAASSDDVMNATLSPGVRKQISDLDVQILLAAYEAAEGGASGFAPMAAAMTAETPLTESYSTADFDRIDGQLEGEVTWDMLLRGRLDNGSPTAKLDAIDAIYERNVAGLVETTQTVRSISHRREIGVDNADESDDDFFAQLAATQDHEAQPENALDAAFTEWDELIVQG